MTRIRLVIVSSGLRKLYLFLSQAPYFNRVLTRKNVFITLTSILPESPGIHEYARPGTDKSLQFITRTYLHIYNHAAASNDTTATPVDPSHILERDQY